MLKLCAPPKMESMPYRPTRREALRTLAASAAASSGLVMIQPAGLFAQAASHKPRNFTQEEFELLETLVEMIIPESETPGAAAAGVHRIIDLDLTLALEDGGEEATKQLAALKSGLGELSAEGFAAKDEQERVAVLTAYSKASGARGEFFETLKGLTVDAYYSTEIGLIQELGYKGNTYLPEFPGCQHKEHLDGA